MHQRDLTKGPVFSTLCVFALPMILGNVLQQCYNVADTWVVGHFIGAGALAAVGSAFSLMTFLTSILLGMSMGSGVVMSVCYGKKDEKQLKEGISVSFLLIGCVTVLLTALALIGTEGIMTWLNIPGEIRDITRVYLVRIFWGIPAVALYNYFSAYLKAMGDSVIPIVFLGISTVLNIVLDIVFVAVLGRGTAGAAEATIIAQYVSGVGITLYVFWKSSRIREAFRHFEIHKNSVREIANYSFMTCIQQSVMNLGILMVQGIVNSFGTVVMAAFAAAVKIEAFSYMPAQEYGNAFSTFIAQNAGAGAKGRIKQGIHCAVKTVVVYCLAASLLIWTFARALMLIFVQESETQILVEGVRYLRIVGLFYLGIGCLFLWYGLYRAIGKPSMSLVLTIVSLGTRVSLSYFLSKIPAVGVVGIWCSIPIGWVLADLLGLVKYKMIQKIEER